MAPDLLRAIPLGGVGEIGKNSTLFECRDDLVLIDAGVKFPDERLHGVDLVIPDYTYLLEHVDRLRGVLITHGHEDHIGGLPYLLMQMENPEPLAIYGTRLSLGLITVKLQEHGLLGRVRLEAFDDGDRITLGAIQAEVFEVNHSVPGAVGFVLRTPVGTVFFTGDFKFDPDPPDGKTTDMDRLRQLGDEGILALFSDCTRVEQPGWTPSERTVDESIEQLIREASGRVIVTTFASNLGRLQRVIQSAHRLGRRTSVAGRSMEENLKVAAKIGYLNIPDGSMVELKQVASVAPDKLVLLTTGSQGEPTSVLSRMAAGEHPLVKVQPTDTVIYSASPIPGNEDTVAHSIDNLFRRGANVIYRAINDKIHVSGHASREELRQMIDLLRPRYTIPLHGEFRMLVLYRELAMEAGLPSRNVLLTEIGDVVEFEEGEGRVTSHVTAGAVLVDGLTIGDVTRVVLRDRHRLASDGVLIASIVVDRESGDLLSGPDFISRGFIDPAQDGVLEDARVTLSKSLDKALRSAHESGILANRVREVLSGFIYERTRRRPMILPVVTEV
ncbi:MAG: ribonuclease J [Chloroflexota bacterium]